MTLILCQGEKEKLLINNYSEKRMNLRIHEIPNSLPADAVRQANSKFQPCGRVCLGT
jgi:hypothetical protein